MSSPKHDRSVENAIEEEEEEEEQNHLLKAEKNSQGATARRKGQGGDAVINVPKEPQEVQPQAPPKKTKAKLATSVLKRRCRSLASRSFWFSALPCLGWATNYQPEWVIGDVIAGITTALTVIPQGIGYAPLAGLPLQYGLYGSIIPGFTYALLGTTREATIGPTAVNALMSYNYAGANVINAVTLAFFCGLIEILAGFFKLGFLINFISAPVISAFTSAVSIQVATSQVKGLLGLKVPGRGFFNTWIAVFENFEKIRPCDASVGFASIGILLFLRQIKNVRWCEGRDPESRRARVLARAKWLVSVSRNCLVVVLSTVIAYYLLEVWDMKDALIITGDVESGIPEFQLPWRFNADASTGNSSSASSSSSDPLPGPFEIAGELGAGIVMLPLVSIIQHVAIAKYYAAPSQRVPASQELLALGTSQLVGSFVGSICVTASFGRSAVNSDSGVRSPFGGIVTGGIILLACAYLTPHFAYIPTSALAAVIITAMIFTIDIEILLPLWKAKKLDLVPYSLTFFLGLFVSVEVGMIAGTLTHLAILVYNASKPKVAIEEGKVDGISYILVRPDRGLFFPAVDDLRSVLGEAAAKGGHTSTREPAADEATAKGGHGEARETMADEAAPQGPVPVIVDMAKVAAMDYTAAAGIRALSKQMKKSGQPVYFCSVQEDIEHILQGVDPSLFISYVNVQDAEQKIRGS